MNIEDLASEIDIYLAYTKVKEDKEREAYLYEQGEVNEEEPMNEVKALRLAAGLTQRELSELSLVDNLYTKTSYHSFYQQEITIPEIEAAELGLGEALTETQWGFMQSLCNDRINIFKRDAGLTIKLG